ncbi:MAG: dihydrofolate reductase family protein [Nocardioidaceae bacterium]
MPKTQYYVAATIDGFIADPDGEIDWLLQFEGIPGLEEHYRRFLDNTGAVAMGRSTYDYIVKSDQSWPYPDLPSWVFTSRPAEPAGGADIRFTARDVAAVHADLVSAAGDKNIWLIGGGHLVASFAEQHLLDEIWLGVAPVSLGAGSPLLPLRIDAPMTLSEITRFGDSGFVELRYELNP